MGMMVRPLLVRIGGGWKGKAKGSVPGASKHGDLPEYPETICYIHVRDVPYRARNGKDRPEVHNKRYFGGSR